MTSDPASASLGKTGPASPRTPDPASVRMALVLLLLVAITFGYGLHVARTRPLDVWNYLQNYHHHEPDRRLADPQGFDAFQIWTYADGQSYLSIASIGYPHREEFVQGGPGAPKLLARDQNFTKWAFVPLWPLAIRAGSWLTGSVTSASVLLANAFGVLAMLLLHGYLARRHGAQAAFWTVLLLAVYPFSVFYAIPYSESLFLLLVVLTFRAVAAGSYPLAALWIGLASLTRPYGIALGIVPVAAAAGRWIEARRVPRREALSLLWLALAFVPLAAWIAYNVHATGDPLYFVHVREKFAENRTDPFWVRFLRNTWETLVGFDELDWRSFRSSKVDALSMLGSLALLLLTLRVAPAEYAAYAAVAVLVPLASKQLMSYCRHVVVAWPLFFTLVAVVEPRYRAWALGILAAIFLALRLVLVSDLVVWRWIG